MEIIPCPTTRCSTSTSSNAANARRKRSAKRWRKMASRLNCCRFETGRNNFKRMDHSSIVKGIIVSVYLVTLVVLLVIFLVWQQVPRRAIFEIVQISILIFAISSGISYQIADRLVLNGGDSRLIYIPPVIPVAIFTV